MGRHLKLLTAIIPLCAFCLGVMAVGPPSGVTPVGIAKSNPASANPAQLTPSAQDRLLGKWEGVTAGKTVFEMEFLKDGKGTFREADEDGRPQVQSFRYTTDVEKVPHELDLYLGGDIGLTIFEFTPDGWLHMAEPGEQRPTNYDKETIIFRKADKDAAPPATIVEADRSQKKSDLPPAAKAKPSAPAAATGSAVPQDAAHDSGMSYKNCKILGEKGSRGNYDIYLMNHDGSDLTNLTKTPYGFLEKHARWSPDGTRILYCTETSRNPTRQQAEYAGEIYVMNADGGNKRNMTQHPAKDYDPSWSPDGKQIVFVSNRDGKSKICLINADGTGKRALTGDGTNGGHPRWSPDGTKIAFISKGDIFVINSDGTGQRNITNDPARDSDFAWSPDGKTIGFSSIRNKNGDVYTVKPDGNDLKRLTFHSGDDEFAGWSPDGKRLFFVSDREKGATKSYMNIGDYKTYSVDVNGNNMKKFMDSLPFGGIVWSPDGAVVATSYGEDLYLLNPDGSEKERFADRAMTDMSWSPLAYAMAVKAGTHGAGETMGSQAGSQESFPPGQWVDVLKHVDLREDLVSGQWCQTEDGVAVAAGNGARIMLPMRVEGSYELAVDFTRNKGDADLAVLFPIGSGAGALCVGVKNREIGIGTIDGRWAGANLTTRQVRPFVNGQRYTVRIVVDAMEGSDATVEVFLNQQPSILWKGKQSSVRLRDLWQLPEANRPGLGAYGVDVTFHAARLRVTSGQVDWVRDAPGSVAGQDAGNPGALNARPALDRLLGRWQGVGRRNGGMFEYEFRKGGKGTMWQQDREQGAASYPMQYTAKADKVPYELDVTLEGYTGFAIFEFTSEGELRMAGPDEQRPKAYGIRDTVLMRKVSDSDPKPGTEAWAATRWKIIEERTRDKMKRSGVAATNDWRGFALHDAVAAGQLGMVKAHLENGADPNAKNGDGQTTLFPALTIHRATMAELLLAHGADPKAKLRDGTSILHYAAAKGRLEHVKLLLEHGADAKEKTVPGRMPILMAPAMRGHLSVMTLLLENGADPNERCRPMGTPLHSAAGRGDLKMVKLLLENGADPKAKRRDGKTPLALAVRSRKPQVVSFLKQHLAVNP